MKEESKITTANILGNFLTGTCIQFSLKETILHQLFCSPLYSFHNMLGLISFILISGWSTVDITGCVSALQLKQATKWSTKPTQDYTWNVLGVGLIKSHPHFLAFHDLPLIRINISIARHGLHIVAHLILITIYAKWGMLLSYDAHFTHWRCCPGWEDARAFESAVWSWVGLWRPLSPNPEAPLWGPSVGGATPTTPLWGAWVFWVPFCSWGNWVTERPRDLTWTYR